MSIKSAIARICLGSSKPESIRWAEAHDARLQGDEQVQQRKRAAAVKVAREYRKVFLPTLALVWAGAAAMAWQLPGWPEVQGGLIGGATVIACWAYSKFCVAQY